MDISSPQRYATQHAILTQFLTIAAFEGWNETTLTKACVAAGEHPLAGKRLFSEGITELAHFYHQHINDALIALAKQHPLTEMRVHERIHWLVMTRLFLCEPHKEAVRRLVAFAHMPQHLAWGSTELWHICDVIWRLAGDSSTDMNYYSKRSLLAAVYHSAVIYWLQDDSADTQETAAFVTRRIQTVLTVGKTFGNATRNITTRVEQFTDRITNPRRYRTKKT